MDRIRWGVLSTAKIAVEKVIPAMQQCEFASVVAIASRELSKAKEVSKKLNLAKAYGTYEELLNDPEIDAIYNPLPNHLHVDWSVKALQAGKHVLCEKPIALSVSEAERLVKASAEHPNLKIMEAFMYRLHPQWQKAKELVQSGAIGELKTIQSFFSYHNTDATNIRNQADIGGGGMMDIGCYCISLSRFIFQDEPTQVMGMVEYDPSLRIDRLSSGMMKFKNGHSSFTCSTQLVPYQRVNIFGTTGRIEIEVPFNAPADKPCKVWLVAKGELKPIRFEVVNQYTLQGDAFSQAILNNTPVPTGLSDAVKNMKVIEAIFESEKKGERVTLG